MMEVILFQQILNKLVTFTSTCDSVTAQCHLKISFIPLLFKQQTHQMMPRSVKKSRASVREIPLNGSDQSLQSDLFTWPILAEIRRNI